MLMALVACREDEYIVYSDSQTLPATSSNHYNGLYLLNEGNMGMNHCTLDYLDLTQSVYHRNIYAQCNPNTIKELGDVGNDLQAYGSKLWIVVNCSNKVEVCHLQDATRIGQIDIPNCRYITFHQKSAYVSSFVGPVSLQAHAQLGRIYQIDTLTLCKVDSVTVGYQPEEMAIVDNRLYVANSGGYLLPNYSNTLSQINLSTLQEELQIPVGTNPHRVRKDHLSQLWVSTRGNYTDIPPALFTLSPDTEGQMVVTDSLPIAISDMQIVGDTLWYFGSIWHQDTQSNTLHFGMIDIRTHQPISTHLFDAPQIQHMVHPYGLLVNLYDGDFYLMDARNYISSGQLLHFLPDGSFHWQIWTGDIPSRGVLVSNDHATTPLPQHPDEPYHPYIAAVDEYVPAPGQFVNTMPHYDEGDDVTAMVHKCTEAIANNAGGLITLGGFGGYITFHFGSAVRNIANYPDFQIWGNAHSGSSEPGIVMVSIDSNHNNLPDDTWYELAGSADQDSIGQSIYGYQVTYTACSMQDIPWTDSRGASGVLPRNSFHTQEYFPQWLNSPLTLQGTLLPPNGHDESGNGSYWVTTPLRFGYVDNVPNTDQAGCSFDLDWAVDPISRQPVHLTHADFIRVYSAQHQVCGWLGETSTEISGARMNN